MLDSKRGLKGFWRSPHIKGSSKSPWVAQDPTNQVLEDLFQMTYSCAWRLLWELIFLQLIEQKEATFICCLKNCSSVLLYLQGWKAEGRLDYRPWNCLLNTYWLSHCNHNSSNDITKLQKLSLTELSKVHTDPILNWKSPYLSHSTIQGAIPSPSAMKLTPKALFSFRKAYLQLA